MAALLAGIFLLAGVTVGLYYYFKIVRPGKDEDQAESENLEFYDGGPYINEDTDGQPDSGSEE